GVRVAAAPACDAALAGRCRSGTGSGRLPRAHETLRGGRSRHGGGALGPVRPAAERRAHARGRPGGGGRGRGRRRGARGRLGARRGRRAAEAGGGARRSPDRRREEPPLSRLAVVRIDNSRRRCYRALDVGNSDNKAVMRMRRLAPAVLLLVLFVPCASAWTWPVRGPLLETFSFDQAHPYAAGQQRGIAIGADAGAPVLAPAAGVVSFAGTVAANGKTVTIQTAAGLAVSLTHLGSIAVQQNDSVAEGVPLGTVGPSGTA